MDLLFSGQVETETIMSNDYKIVVSDKGQIYLIYTLALTEKLDELAKIETGKQQNSEYGMIKINELKCAGLKDNTLFQSEEKAVLIDDIIFIKGSS